MIYDSGTNFIMKAKPNDMGSTTRSKNKSGLGTTKKMFSPQNIREKRVMPFLKTSPKRKDSSRK